MPPIDTPDAIFAYLDALGLAHRSVSHAAAFTVEESRARRGDLPGGHTKNLFLKDKKGRLFLVVAREDATVDLKRLHERIGAAGRLSFAGAEAMRETLGVAPGSVTALGLVNDREKRLTVAIDRGLLAHDAIHAHPLVNTITTTLAREDFLRFLAATGHEPLIVDVEPAEAGREP